MYVYRWSNAAWWPTMFVVTIRLPGKTHHPALAPATTQLSQTTHQPLNQSERTYVSDTDFSTNEEQEESQWGRWGRGRGGRRPFSLQCSCLRLKCTTWDLVTTVTARNTSHWASPDINHLVLRQCLSQLSWCPYPLSGARVCCGEEW